MNKKFITPAIFAPFAQLRAAETTRHDGVSKAPFASLNMGNFTDDLAENILENRRLVLEDLGFSMSQFAYSKQVHDDKILHVTAAGAYEGYDALFTQTPGLMLGITIADCTPILIYDAHNQVIAAIHAGWKGTVLQIVYKTLTAMQRNFGTQGKDCYAYVGTCIDECEFEVGDEVASHFEEMHKVFYSHKNKYHVNLKAANQSQLIAFGIPAKNIAISPFSTVGNNNDYFSHRAEKGQTGRMMCLIGMTNS
jgi:YfiH family protein